MTSMKGKMGCDKANFVGDTEIVENMKILEVKGIFSELLYQNWKTIRGTCTKGTISPSVHLSRIIIIYSVIMSALLQVY
jgi:hypothetical protein